MGGLFKDGGAYSPPEDSREKKRNSSLRWKVLAAVLLLLCVILLIIVIVLAVKLNSGKHDDARKQEHDQVKSCGQSTKMQTAKKSSGIFEDLSKEEILAVRDYMLAQPTLKLTPYDKATVNSNYIYFIKLYLPSKKEALSYLDNGGAKPERQALVSVFKGAQDIPIVEEFIVAPTAKPARHEENRVPGQRYPIPFNARPFDDVIELAALEKLVRHEVTSKVHPLLVESFDGFSFDNCTNKCLILLYSSPMGSNSKKRKNWHWFNRAVTGSYEFPINFELYIQHEGADVAKWKVEKIVYNDQIFDTAESLMTAYNNDTKKSNLLNPKGDDTIFATYERRGKPQPNKPSRGPEQYEPDGQRYAVDSRRVEYMGWEFEFRVDSSSGLAAYDVRFNGERIIYELSIQEATATYAGYYPSQTSMNFLDVSWKMGKSSYEMVRGVDCPNTATFFDLTHLIGAGEPQTMKHAVCVFELNTGIPLRRHYDNNFQGGYNFYGGMVNNVMVLRTIATVYNYDYIWDFIFYQNGVIQVKVSASGYVMGSFYTDKVKRFGYPLYKQLTSAVHDHLLNIKVDLDVAGQSNCYETIEIAIENVTSHWHENARRVRKVLQPTTLKTEEEAAFKFNFDRPKYLNFYSAKEKNRMGTRRGYRIQHAGIVKQLYPEDWLMVPMISWSLYQLAVTRYKESERHSSSIYNQNSPADPQVDFRSFIGNESIVNQDLVAWVTMGMMHVPHSEDLPNTATAGSTASFYIRPFNYFDEDPSIASTNAILITPSDKEASGRYIERYGTPAGPVCVPVNHSTDFSGRYDG